MTHPAPPADTLVGSRPGDWSPPYRLQGDSWAFLGFARRDRVAAAAGGAPIESLLGWAPLLVQGTRYVRATSIAERNERSVQYTEISVTALGRRDGRWVLVPVALLVDQPLAQRLGEPYGFPKVLAALRCEARAWSLYVADGDGRWLVGRRGLGALLFWPLKRWLSRWRVRVLLPGGGATALQFEAVERVAPAVGSVSSKLAAWAFGSVLFPVGFALQGVQFVLEAPHAD